MGYIQFDKTELINLKYSLSKEFIRSNRAGSFAGSTIINCNTRKYHGLLICPLDQVDGENHVLLSALDETIIQHDKEFHLAVRKYPGVLHPGHKYLREFKSDPIPTLIYHVGGVVLQKEMLFAANEDQVLIKYTLLDAHSPTTLKLHPFLSFRNIHELCRANLDVNTKFSKVENGIKTRMYSVYPYLFMQMSKNAEYIHAPNWFYNVEYSEEERRGYEYTEDLFVPGYFEFPMKKDESIIFAAGLKEVNVKELKAKFKTEISSRIPRNTFENCLINSAQQFIVHRNNKTEIVAGYPWFATRDRDTFISLPGLTLSTDEPSTAKEILDNMSKQLKDGLFRNTVSKHITEGYSVDAPLWYFWAIQKYVEYTGKHQEVWKDYGPKMKSILDNYKKGTSFNIKMHENGLIYSGETGKALTWMDAVYDGVPVTPRTGYAVEVNALWYNAIMFALELAEIENDTKFIKQWSQWPEKIKESFVGTFWNEKKKFLSDYVRDGECNWHVRPNQIFAVSLPYIMLSKSVCKAVLDVVENELLTPKGLRTLSPNSVKYKGVYEGNVESRDNAYHQGTVWPWLLGAFCEAYLKIHKESGIQKMKDLYNGFEVELTNAGIGTISEIYDGIPPHEAKGAISQAWSVAELLRIRTLIASYEKNH